jgi:hypothetical protein
MNKQSNRNSTTYKYKLFENVNYLNAENFIIIPEILIRGIDKIDNHWMFMKQVAT